MPVASIDDHLAGLDLADEVRADDVERRGLAREHPAALDAPEHERPEAVPVAHADEVRLVHEHEREATLEAREHRLERDLEVAAVGARLGRVLARDELGDERGVGGRVDVGTGRCEAGQHPERCRRARRCS